MRTLALGISPCPNDTFVFHGLLSGAVQPAGCAVAIGLHDVEELNQRLFARGFDAAKASAFAALNLAHDMVVLRAGSALGFGAGPLLLARPGAPALRAARVLCPGRWTTAHLLYRLFHAAEGRVEQARFSEILPALERGTADYGVCIHEGRFTFAERGLLCVEDLGETWERRTRSPLPLGCIVARRTLGAGAWSTMDAAIRASLDHARAHPTEALCTMRTHAQELSDAVIQAHVELYVNDFTRDLGAEGARALRELSQVARGAGLLPAHLPELEVAP